MKPLRPTVVVLVTAPDLKTARQLATGALRARLAACANLLPKIESHYWWQGKLEAGTEVLLLFKTTRARLSALEKFILAHHPYPDLADWGAGGAKRADFHRIGSKGLHYRHGHFATGSVRHGNA